VILIDEWVAYARQLVDADDLPGGTFDTQFTFAQSLTEAVKATPGVLLAISIPAPHDRDASPTPAAAEEIGGTHGRAALTALQNVVGRLSDHWQPASAEEAYHIVRRRLFTAADRKADGEISKVAKRFVELYREHGADFPSEARDADYRDRIKNCYPIHPELFDRLYHDWSTLERFQRTRGVLRLMNAVIHELWTANDTAPLIMPGSVPLANRVVKAELTQYLHDRWPVIIDTDVDGPPAAATRLDKKKRYLGKRSLSRRVARTVVIGAAPTVGSPHKGVELARVLLGTAMPGDVVGNIHSALASLADTATYFYSGGDRYWFDAHPNVTQQAKDQAERLGEEDVWADVIRRLEGSSGANHSFARVVVAPEGSADIADLDEVQLVLVHPKHGHRKRGGRSPAVEFAYEATERRGDAPRQRRNMVVYLAGDHDRLVELFAAVREHLAWQQVVAQADNLYLTEHQLKQSIERRDRADRTADDRLSGAYHWVLVPEQEQPGQPFTITLLNAESAAPLAERASRQLVKNGLLTDQCLPSLVRDALDGPLRVIWDRGYLRLGDLWSYYANHPFMARLRDRSVLDAGVLAGLTGPDVLTWHAGGFAVADGYDAGTRTYRGLVLPDDRAAVQAHDGLLLVRPDVAMKQRERDIAAGTVSPRRVLSADVRTDGQVRRDLASRRPKRFVAAQTLNPRHYGADFKRIADEVLRHLAAAPGVALTVAVEIKAEAPDGFDDATLRTVRENAATLRMRWEVPDE
jgi:hypothetical protein